MPTEHILLGTLILMDLELFWPNKPVLLVFNTKKVMMGMQGCKVKGSISLVVIKIHTIYIVYTLYTQAAVVEHSVRDK